MVWGLGFRICGCRLQVLVIYTDLRTISGPVLVSCKNAGAYTSFSHLQNFFSWQTEAREPCKSQTLS